MTKPDGTDLTFGDVHAIIDGVKNLIDAMIKMIAQIVDGAQNGFKDKWVAAYDDWSYSE